LAFKDAVICRPAYRVVTRENKILEACFRNLLGLATRMFRVNNRCIVEWSVTVEDLTTSIDGYIKQTKKA